MITTLTTVDKAVRWWSTERSDRIALQIGADGISYQDLDAWAGRVAARYAALGVEIGDRVCLHALNSMEWCVAALGAIRCGAYVAGINDRMVAAEVAYLLGDYAPRVLVIDEGRRGRVEEIGALVSRHGEPVRAPALLTVEDIAALRAGAPDDIRREIDPDACVVIVTTSGSTARPKGVMLTHRSMIDYATNIVMEEGVDAANGKFLIAMPMSTGAGMIQLVQSLSQGATAYLQITFDPAEALHIITREKITTFCGAPIFFQRVADLPKFDAADVSSIHVSQTGGAAVALPLLKKWSDKGVLLRQIYGQTECGGNATANPRRYALSHPDKCGHGGLFHQIGIIDGEGNFLPPGEQGQIVLRGPGLMKGYWNDPAATAATLVDGWLRTGDIGVIDELGLLKFVDRAKDIIISGGLNISAAEVERVLLEHPAVEEAAVFSAPDERFGETPLAIVYGAAAISVPDLIIHCDANLSNFKVPRYVLIREAPLPRLATGKISKPLLRAEHITDKPLPERVR